MFKLTFLISIVFVIIFIGKYLIMISSAEDIPNKNSINHNNDQEQIKSDMDRINKTIEGIDVKQIANSNSSKTNLNIVADEVEAKPSQQVVKTVDADIDDAITYKLENPVERAVIADKEKNNLEKKNDGVREVANVNEGRSTSSVVEDKSIGKKDFKTPDYTGVMWEYDVNSEFRPQIDPKSMEK
ncbi:MAG: hypothetical protein HQK51_00650 [Oligoflexia bacterium]|nr:hypothetical protein [Oligoflexia bacterium]